MMETFKFLGAGIGAVTVFSLVVWIVETCREIICAALAMGFAALIGGYFIYLIGKTILTGHP